MVLAVLVKNRARVKVLMDNESSDYLFTHYEGIYNALCIAIALLRCPLRMLIEEYNRIENGK